MNQTAHLLGNGPSWSRFLKEPNVGDVYACNMAHDEVGDRIIASFIHDGRVFRHFEKMGIIYPYPIITEAKTRKSFQGLAARGAVKFHEGLITTDIREKNSGQDGFHWLIKNGVYDEIHLWGFDSFTEGDMYSLTLEKIPDSRQSSSIMNTWNLRMRELITLAETGEIRVEIH